MFNRIAFATIVVEVRTAVAARGDALTFYTIDRRTHRDRFGRANRITRTAVVHIRRFVDA